MFNKIQITVILIITFSIVIISMIVIFTSSPQPEPGPQDIPIFSPSPTVRTTPSTAYSPILSSQVPFIPQQQGGGVDTTSSLVTESQAEITKVLPLLPYSKTLTSTNGTTLSILVPDQQYQDTPWLLNVQIYGINYYINPDEPDYNNQKTLFLTAVAYIFNWLRSNNIDANKIIINWGDLQIVRDSSERWLKE